MTVLLVLLSNLVRSYEAIQVLCEDRVKVVLVLRSNLVGSCGVIQVSCEDRARVVLELRSDLTGSCKCRVRVVCGSCASCMGLTPGFYWSRVGPCRGRVGVFLNYSPNI